MPENFLELHYKKCTDGAIFPEIDTIPASRSLVLHVEVIYTLETGRESVHECKREFFEIRFALDWERMLEDSVKVNMTCDEDARFSAELGMCSVRVRPCSLM